MPYFRIRESTVGRLCHIRLCSSWPVSSARPFKCRKKKQTNKIEQANDWIALQALHRRQQQQQHPDMMHLQHARSCNWNSAHTNPFCRFEFGGAATGEMWEHNYYITHKCENSISYCVGCRSRLQFWWMCVVFHRRRFASRYDLFMEFRFSRRGHESWIYLAPGLWWHRRHRWSQAHTDTHTNGDPLKIGANAWKIYARIWLRSTVARNGKLNCRKSLKTID